MTRCEVPFETLSAYVDGELDASQELELRRHLDGCDRCREAVDALQGLKELVTSAAEIRPVPHTLRESTKAIAVRRKPRRASWFLWPTTAAVMVGLLILEGTQGWLMVSRPTSADLLVKALITDHSRYLSSPNAIQVASSDPLRIAAVFESQTGFPIELPHLSSANLLGARFCRLLGHRGVLSFYESRGKRFSLFVLDRTVLPNGDFHANECRSVGAYEVCLIPDAPQLLAMVGDKDQAQLFLPELENQARHAEP
jgi:anti-sigma factor RsiW